MQLAVPRWFDLHTHFRQGPAVGSYIKAHLAMGCAGALAMPNTQPPVSRVTGAEEDGSWSIESYTEFLLKAGGFAFEDLLVPLYLTPATTPDMIEQGAASGVLRAAKYYPPHGTTNSEHGLPMEELLKGDVLRAMADNGIPLCIHGEEHGLTGEAYLDSHTSAESVFYAERMPRLLDSQPSLRIVCEHITTKEAAAFVRSAPVRQVGATITPQHLLYTIGHLIQGLRYHLYCLPIVKFDADRAALAAAVSEPGQNRFFAGTDSAPHTTKATDCGCAAGCFTGGSAPQLYAMGFERAGIDLGTDAGRDLFTRFLSTNGPEFYGFPSSRTTFDLIRTPSKSTILDTPAGPVTPLPMGMGLELDWSIG